MSKRNDERLTVNMISESEFTVQGHGVHTAYKEITDALRKRKDVDIEVNTDRPADIIHIQTMGLYSFRRLIKKGGKKVVSAHLVPDSFVGSIKGAKYWKPLSKMWLKFFYRKADLVLACSGMVAEELINDMNVPKTKVFYNTIDMSRYKHTAAEKKTARKKLGLKDGDFVVMGNGQVQPRKRLDVLIKAAKQMPDVKFFWVGGIPFKNLGADYGAMQRMMKNAPDNLIITGVIPLDDVRDYYVAADIFVLPSVQENHPMCVLEAAGAELPIVLRDIPQYDDTFKGDAIMAKTDDEFLDLIDMLHRDKQAYSEAQRGAKRIAKKFDSSAGAERLVEFYRSLI